MYNLSVPEKISVATARVAAVASYPLVFLNAGPLLASVSFAINALDTAWKKAEDGGTKDTAQMHDKEEVLMQWMKSLANFVEDTAKGDEAIVHLAGMQVKVQGQKYIADFEVFLPDDLGAVGLRCKARKKTIYRWEYSKDPAGSFVSDHQTDVCTSFIGNLDSNVPYWFRVVLINKTGDHPLDAKCITPL